MPAVFILLAMPLVFLAAPPAWAQGESGAKVQELIQWAQKAEADLEYDRAAEFWASIIAHPNASEAQKVDASLHAGIIERVRGNRAEARDHFEYVLRRDINHKLPEGTEPKIANFFELIRDDLKKQAAGATASTAAASPSAISTDGDGAVQSGAARSEGGGSAWIFYAVGGGAAVLGASALGTAGVLGMRMQQLAAQANEEEVQLARNDLYDDHDALVLPNNILIGTGVGLVVMGAALASIPLFTGE
jgi:hypothetical protein